MSNDKDPAATDHQSDPARTPGYGWVGEGGASHLGPATHLRAAHESVEGEQHDADEDNAAGDAESTEE